MYSFVWAFGGVLIKEDDENLLFDHCYQSFLTISPDYQNQCITFINSYSYGNSKTTVFNLLCLSTLSYLLWQAHTQIVQLISIIGLLRVDRVSLGVETFCS